MSSTGFIFSKRLVQVWLPFDEVNLLRNSKWLWDGKDELRFEKHGKIPSKRKVIRKLMRNHIEYRDLKKD